MEADEVRRRFQAGYLRPVLDFAEVWFQKRPSITFHDPLAAVGIFDPTICTYDVGQVDVELEVADYLGQTKWQSQIAGPHSVAVAVDSERFFDHYFSVLGG
jgi:purine nucleosidase